MRKLFASLMLGLSMFSALAHAIPDWIIPSPLAIAIQIGKAYWTQESDDEVYYIRVQSRGSTETQARTEAFRLAVDQAVGSLLVSETKILNDKFSHETVNYSSGYIHDFKYVNIHRDNEVVLQVDVWVKKSKIAERIALESLAQGELEGGRIAESFRSLKEENNKGDQLVRTVLDDFPERAMLVNIENIEYTYNNRVPVLNIQFASWWNEKYVDALRETVKNVGEEHSLYQQHSMGTTFVKESCVFCGNRHYALDQARSRLVWEGVWNKRPNVLVTIFDVHNSPVYSHCWYWDNMQGNGYAKNLFDSSMHNTTIYPDRWVKNYLNINLKNSDVSRMDRVDLKIVRESACPKQ